MRQSEAEQVEFNLDPIKEKLRRFLLENFASAGDVEIEDDHSLLQLGIIDSLSLVNIIGYIEEEFDIKVSPRDFFPVNSIPLPKPPIILRAPASSRGQHENMRQLRHPRKFSGCTF